MSSAGEPDTGQAENADRSRSYGEAGSTPTTLSAKAKGKQPAPSEDVNDSHDDSQKSNEQDDHQEQTLTVVVKFSDAGMPDAPIQVENVAQMTVPELRSRIRRTVGGTTLNRRLRLIHGGRVLNEQTDFAREVAGVRIENGRIVNNGRPRQQRVYVHCAIGDVLTATELARENEFDQRVPTRSTLPTLRGFDRLRDTGFTDEDISELRQQFSAMYGSDDRNQDEQARLEEQWIDTGVMDGGADASNILGGDYLDDLVGILIGMFLGVFVLIFIKIPGVFTKRQQRTLFAGAFINLGLGFLLRAVIV